MNIQIGHDTALVESKKKLISGTYLRNAWYCAAWSLMNSDPSKCGTSNAQSGWTGAKLRCVATAQASITRWVRARCTNSS